MEAIEITGLTKAYKALTAVNDLNLTIHPGELFSLLGVNGAGKTTTIKMLTCLTRPTSGDALVEGCSILQDPDKVKAKIGVSPQETAVAPNLTVEENLRLICGIHGLSPEKTAEKIREITGIFSLVDTWHMQGYTHSIDEMSKLMMDLLTNPAIKHPYH